MNLPKTEQEFNKWAADYLEANKAQTIDEAISNLDTINAMWKTCFGEI